MKDIRVYASFRVASTQTIYKIGIFMRLNELILTFGA